MTPAVAAAKRAGIDFEVIEYDAGDSGEPYGIGAARALGIAPERVFKTLVVDSWARLSRGLRAEAWRARRGNAPTSRPQGVARARTPDGRLPSAQRVADPQVPRLSTTLRCVPAGRWLTRLNSPVSKRSGSAR